MIEGLVLAYCIGAIIAIRMAIRRDKANGGNYIRPFRFAQAVFWAFVFWSVSRLVF